MSRIADKTLVEEGKKSYQWACKNMPTLIIAINKTSENFSFNGTKIAVCLHVTKETSVLVMGLKKLGADVYLAGANPLSTQDEIAAYLDAEGINVFSKVLEAHGYLPYGYGDKDITNVVIKVLPFRREKIFDSEEELIILAELGEEEGTLQEEESDMIQSIFDFKEKTVGEIITPRVDIVSLKSDESIDKAMDIIGERQFSKIPIYKDTIDNIKGILYAKDIIPYLMGSRPNVNLQTLARQPFFVPETKPIDDLMEEFKLRKTSIAIVVDEWGGTEGLVTLEDVVEEVMGEIRDPYDQEEFNAIRQSDGSFIVDGSITIYDLEEETDIEFPEERDYDTLGGFILDILTDIPKTGEKVEFNNMVFTVQTIENNRIGKIKIQINS